MSRREPTRAQISHGMTYVAQKPAFLQNFGLGGSSSSGRDSDRDFEGRGGRGGRDRDARDGREPLPERPSEGRWARGSDGGSPREDDEEEDEWEATYGGGDDGPQIVVLKEGRHLSKDEVERERRRAAGIASPPPEDKKTSDDAEGKQMSGTSAKTGGAPPKPGRPTPAANKRKLVGDAVATNKEGADGAKKPKKKKKAAKGLLSFDEAEGEA